MVVLTDWLRQLVNVLPFHHRFVLQRIYRGARLTVLRVLCLQTLIRFLGVGSCLARHMLLNSSLTIVSLAHHKLLRAIMLEWSGKLKLGRGYLHVGVTLERFMCFLALPMTNLVISTLSLLRVFIRFLFTTPLIRVGNTELRINYFALFAKS